LPTTFLSSYWVPLGCPQVFLAGGRRRNASQPCAELLKGTLNMWCCANGYPRDLVTEPCEQSVAQDPGSVGRCLIHWATGPSTPERRGRTLASRHAPQFAVSSARQPDSPRHSNTHTHFRPLMTTAGLEPTPFRTDASSQHPRPLGQTVLGAAKNHNATRSSLTIWGARKFVESAGPNFWL
jgi:hypothetical protein